MMTSERIHFKVVSASKQQTWNGMRA